MGNYEKAFNDLLDSHMDLKENLQRLAVLVTITSHFDASARAYLWQTLVKI